MRIGLGTTMIEPGLNGGRLDGIGVYTKALFEHLPEAGCQIHAYSFPRARNPVRRDITIGWPLPQSFERASLIDLLTPRVHRIHMPVDLFHAPDYRVVRMDCPIVATLHDALPIKYPDWCNPNMRSIKNWLQSKAAKKAQHIIAPSYFAIDELVECFGVREQDISVVPQGVDEAWLQEPERNAMAVTLKVNRLTPGYFLFVGTLQPRKNVERVLEAYLSMPKAERRERQLVIVGAPGWRCEELVARIEAARQRMERVTWLNKLTNQEQMRHVFAGAGAFIFPSLYEGFGIPVIEAFASGVPALVSNVSSLPEVSQGAALEVDPLSVGDIAAGMHALIHDEFLRKRCIALGRQRAEQLTWKQTASRTAAVYKKVLSG